MHMNAQPYTMPGRRCSLCHRLSQISACLLQDFKAALQSPELMLCRKDVNAVLGDMDAEQATLDYQSIAPEIFQLLSSRLMVSPTACHVHSGQQS